MKKFYILLICFTLLAFGCATFSIPSDPSSLTLDSAVIFGRFFKVSGTNNIGVMVTNQETKKSITIKLTSEDSLQA